MTGGASWPDRVSDHPVPLPGDLQKIIMQLGQEWEKKGEKQEKKNDKNNSKEVKKKKRREIILINK